MYALVIILLPYKNDVLSMYLSTFFFFQAEDGIRDSSVTGGSDVCSSDLWRRLETSTPHTATLEGLCARYWQYGECLFPVVSMTCIAHHQATANAIRLNRRLVEAVARKNLQQNHGSSSEQACAFLRAIVGMCDLPGRVLLQCMQRMVTVTLRHPVLLWIGGQLAHVIGAPSHHPPPLSI